MGHSAIEINADPAEELDTDIGNQSSIAGRVGAALCAHSLGQGWIRRIKETRAVTITLQGERVFREQFRARLE